MQCILGLYRDNGKENGNYYNGLHRDYGVIQGLWPFPDSEYSFIMLMLTLLLQEFAVHGKLCNVQRFL